MIWQFGEQGYDYSINYPSGTSASRLDNKPPRWDYLSQYRRMRLYNTCTSLIKLRTENPLFETRTFSLDVSGAMKKIKLRNDTLAAVVLGNFGTASGNMIAGFYSAGTWYDYLTGDSLTVQNPDTTLTLAAGEARLYMTRKSKTPMASKHSCQEFAGFDRPQSGNRSKQDSQLRTHRGSFTQYRFMTFREDKIVTLLRV
jgi:hypothetical protein